MKRSLKKLTALSMAAAMAFSLAGCSSGNGGETTAAEAAKTDTQAAGTESTGEPVTLKITWWGGQGRHDYTQKMLDAYTASHPNVTFEAMPSGWDGYFDKLATQAASGSMPDIVQMDYLYITTYAKNNSLADLQQFVDDGTIDTSKIDQNLLNTGNINGKLNGMVLSSSYLSVGYNPEVLADAGVTEPDSSWTWDDFIQTAETVKEKTGKYGMAGGPVDHWQDAVQGTEERQRQQKPLRQIHRRPGQRVRVNRLPLKLPGGEARGVTTTHRKCWMPILPPIQM